MYHGVCELERDWCAWVPWRARGGGPVGVRGRRKSHPLSLSWGAGVWRVRGCLEAAASSFSLETFVGGIARLDGDVMGVDMQGTPPASRGSRASGQSSRFAGDATPPRSSGWVPQTHAPQSAVTHPTLLEIFELCVHELATPVKSIDDCLNKIHITVEFNENAFIAFSNQFAVYLFVVWKQRAEGLTWLLGHCWKLLIILECSFSVKFVYTLVITRICDFTFRFLQCHASYMNEYFFTT